VLSRVYATRRHREYANVNRPRHHEHAFRSSHSNALRLATDLAFHDLTSTSLENQPLAEASRARAADAAHTTWRPHNSTKHRPTSIDERQTCKPSHVTWFSFICILFVFQYIASQKKIYEYCVVHIIIPRYVVLYLLLRSQNWRAGGNLVLVGTCR